MPIGVFVLLVLAAVINHWLVAELGQADGDLLTFFVVVLGFPACGMAWMEITGQV